MSTAPDSTDNQIPDQAEQNLLVLWIFSLAWLIASIVLITPLINQALKTDDRLKLLTLVFPASGLFLILLALHHTWRAKKFGRSIFNIQKNPTPPGDDLVGTIHVDHPVISNHPMHLRLACIERTWRPGPRASSRTDRVVWQQTSTVENLPSTQSATDIPVLFHIPADAHPTNRDDPNRQISWRLEARRRCGLLVYFSRFPIPISTPILPQPHSTQASPSRPINTSNPPAHLSDDGITAAPFGGAGLKIHLDAARRKSIGPTIVGLILTTVAVTMFLFSPSDPVMRIPLFAFGAVILLIGAIFDYIAFYLWLVSREITINPDSILLQSRALSFTRSQTFKAPDIAQIVCKIDGTSKSGSSAEQTFYGIQLKTTAGNTTWLASNISQGNHANWLTQAINQTLGLPADESS